jgi:hypothetical protein
MQKSSADTNGVGLDKAILLRKLRINQDRDVFLNRGGYEQDSFNSCAYVTRPRFGRLADPEYMAICVASAIPVRG